MSDNDNDNNTSSAPPPRPDRDVDGEENSNDQQQQQNDSSSSASPTSSLNSPFLRYTLAEMTAIRKSIKNTAVLSANFQSFMKGIAVKLEGEINTIPSSSPYASIGKGPSAFEGAAGTSSTSGSPATATNPNSFFGGRAGANSTSGAAGGGSGVGTPFTPGVDAAGKFPGKGGFKDPNAKDGGKAGDSANNGGGFGGFSRESLFGEVKVAQNAIKERTLLHRVRGVFAKVSAENFKSVRDELCALPIRQSEDKDVREIVHWIYDKAVQPEDEIFVEHYADLIKELTNDISTKDAKKGSAVRKALVEKCQQSFDKRGEVTKSGADEIANNANAETTVESRDSAASAALKAAIAQDDDSDYVKERERKRLRANIKFLAQLFRVQMVTSKVVNYVLYSLLYGSASERRHKPEEYEIEMFCDLIKNTQASLPTDIRAQYLPKYLETVKEHSKNPKTSMRVRCLLEDLVELADNGWKTREERRKLGLLGHNAPVVASGGGAYVPPGSGGHHNNNNNLHLHHNSQQHHQQQMYGNSHLSVHGSGPGTPHSLPIPSPNTLQGMGAHFPGVSGSNGNMAINTNFGPNSNNSNGTPTPPYSPVSSNPPAYPGADANKGGRGRGAFVADVAGGRAGAGGRGGLPAAASSPALPALPVNANKDTIFPVAETFKQSNGQDKKVVLDHFTLLNTHPALKTEHLLALMLKSVQIVRREAERKLVAPMLNILTEAKLTNNTIGLQLINQLAPKIVLEIEDQPKIFQCWAELQQIQFPNIIPPAANSILLRELVKDDAVEFKDIERMLTDTVAPTANWTFPKADDAAIQRFRMLPIIISCSREAEEFDEYGSYNSPADSTNMLSDRGASATNIGEGGDGDSQGVVAAAAPPVRKDLLGYLLTHPQRPRAETALAAEIELDIFGMLTNFDQTSHQNLTAVIKKAKQHPQRSDPAFCAGFFCAIFCYLRLALATGEKTDFDKFRELLTILRVPGENTQLFLRECYMTYCELNGVPAGSFTAMVTTFANTATPVATTTNSRDQNNNNNRDASNENKNFSNWKSQMAHTIQQIVGKSVLPKALLGLTTGHGGY